jgi:streptogramin lyase
MTRIPLSTGAVGIAVGPDGNIWFTEPGAGNVGRFVVP